MTTATDGSTRLWAFGSNRCGQLGTNLNAGNEQSNWTPHLIPEFDEKYGGKRVVRFEAGEHHSMVETADGSLWVFGSNGEGQLGLGDEVKTQPLPQDIADGDGGGVVEQGGGPRSASFGSSHTLVMTQDKEIYAFGMGECLV